MKISIQNILEMAHHFGRRNLFFYTPAIRPMYRPKLLPNAQDIWYSPETVREKWSKAKHLSKINASHFNAVFWISRPEPPADKRCFYRRQYYGMGASMMYRMEDNSWSAPEMLRIRNFENSVLQQFGASMGQDGKTLLFYMTDKKNSYDNDLYVSFYEGNNIWTAPKSLGKNKSFRL